MAYTVTIPLVLGTSQTGLTLSAQLKDTGGVNVGAAVTSGFYEAGLGNYSWTGSIPAGHRGIVVFSASSVVRAISAINPEETEYAQRLAALGEATVVLTSPVAASGDLTIVRGDDYYTADGRAPIWTAEDASGPSIAAATIRFTARHRVTQVETNVVGGVLAADPWSVTVEIPKATTAAWSLGNVYDFDVQATLANAHVITLLSGRMNVVEDFAD